MGSYLAKQGQSIYDICLQTYGTLSLLSSKESALLKLMTENQIGNIDENEFNGKVFTFDEALIFDNSIFQKNQNENIFYITSNPLNYLLQDDGFLLLQDDGSKIII